MNITKTLGLKTSIISTTKSLPKIIETSKDHPSITNFFFAKGEAPKGRYQQQFNDNSLYSVEDNFKEVKTMLKKNFELLQEWFYENPMVLNPRKDHYLVTIKDIANESIELGNKKFTC